MAKTRKYKTRQETTHRPRPMHLFLLVPLSPDMVLILLIFFSCLLGIIDMLRHTLLFAIPRSVTKRSAFGANPDPDPDPNPNTNPNPYSNL